MSSENYIHTGGWINFSHSDTFGKTITVSSRTGSFLLAFLTLYVTIAGTRFWLIIAFLIHQEIASHKLDDGLRIQQQAILRNSGTPMNAAYLFARVAYSWRKKPIKPYIRTLPLAILALACLGAFRAASVLTAEVTRAAGNETLIRSPNCSYWEPGPTLGPYEQGGLRTKLAVDARNAATYSRACYGQASATSTQCKSYMANQLSWKEVTDAKCPFAPDLCFTSPSSVYQMDTERINSHFHLGLNAREEDRVDYRRLTTCAPINADKFLNQSLDGSGNTYYNYSLGHIPGIHEGNLTFVYNNRTVLDNIGYQVEAFSSDVSAVWVPDIQYIPADQADVTVLFITANSLLYRNPNKDLIFTATTEATRSQDGQVVTYRVADNQVAILGCTDQHQFCLPNTSECSDLSTVQKLPGTSQKLPLNPTQNATARYIWNAAYYTNIYFSVGPRGAASLQASESVYQNIQSTMTDTQWITEVQGWFSSSLARLQQEMLDIATGPSQIYPNVKYSTPGDTSQNEIEKELCNTQIIRSMGQHQNFSVLGVAIIIAFSTFFIWFSFVISTTTGWVQRWIHKGEDRRLQWLLDDSLQLQRAAYVGAEEGRWRHDPESIPITESNAQIRTSQHLSVNKPSSHFNQTPQTPKQG